MIRIKLFFLRLFGWWKIKCGCCGKKVRLRDTTKMFYRVEEYVGCVVRVCKECGWFVEDRGHFPS